jgi:hypothetical protein
MRIGIKLLICALVIAGATFVEHARATGFATYFAAVAGTGNVAASSGVSAGTRTSTGTYEVTFTRPINGCAHLVTLRGANPGMVAIAPKAASSTVLIVSIFSRTGVKENRAFNMAVQCNS